MADVEGNNAKALKFFRKKGFERAAIYIWVKKTL
jgi:ribosomal protein S18 acetylase RimI-like enzyme